MLRPEKVRQGFFATDTRGFAQMIRESFADCLSAPINVVAAAT
jgi:hypothetical protein